MTPKTRTVKVVRPTSRDDYFQWPEGDLAPASAAIVLDLSNLRWPVLRCVKVSGTQLLPSHEIPFWLPNVQELMPEDVGRCMDAVLPMMERLAGGASKKRLPSGAVVLDYSERIRGRIDREIDRFLYPEKFTPSIANLENLAAVPVQ